MKKLIVLPFVLLLSISFVAAGPFFEFYDENVFTVKKIFLVQEVFSEASIGVVEDVADERILVGKKVFGARITEKGFEPKVIEIDVGEEVIWRNDREKLTAMIMGMREISKMRSKFLQPGEEFRWKFDKPGKFTYVDSVIIGQIGTIIVS